METKAMEKTERVFHEHIANQQREDPGAVRVSLMDGKPTSARLSGIGLYQPAAIENWDRFVAFINSVDAELSPQD